MPQGRLKGSDSSGTRAARTPYRYPARTDDIDRISDRLGTLVAHAEKWQDLGRCAILRRLLRETLLRYEMNDGPHLAPSKADRYAFVQTFDGQLKFYTG